MTILNPEAPFILLVFETESLCSLGRPWAHAPSAFTYPESTGVGPLCQAAVTIDFNEATGSKNDVDADQGFLAAPGSQRELIGWYGCSEQKTLLAGQTWLLLSLDE